MSSACYQSMSRAKRKTTLHVWAVDTKKPIIVRLEIVKYLEVLCYNMKNAAIEVCVFQLIDRARWTIEDNKWRREHHLVHLKYPQKSFKIHFTDEVVGLDKSADIAILAADTHPAVVLGIIFC